MNKKILMISQTVFPPDIRLEKEIKSLSANGYYVFVICNQYDKTKNPEFEYCSILRIKALTNSVRFNRIINFPIFINPRYLLITLFSILKFKPDFLHAHDLPMMPIAILFGKLFRIQVIFDMHENYPEALKQFAKKGIINFIFKNYHLSRILEKICLKYSNKIIVVIAENKIRLTKLGVNPYRIHLISNTVDVESIVRLRIDDEIINKYKNLKMILYTGAVSPDRGLLTPVCAMKKLIELSLPENYTLVIVGDGPYLNLLKRKARDSQIEQYVKFIGWPGHDKIYSFISLAKICIIPQPSNEFIDTTIPHKLFEYMAMGKPILTSDAKPLKRIIEETKSGEFFLSNNSDDFVDKVLKIESSSINYSENGRIAVREKYNWEHDSKELILLYKQLSEKKPK